jgi:uncharacterized protein YecE (DUF72 family)
MDIMNESGNNRGIFTGPAGWSYGDWDDIFYPRRSGIDKLVFTARFFDCIELNSSFYRIPSPGMVASWVDRTAFRPGFRMCVKAFSEFTHDRNLSDETLTDFKNSFEPLRSSGRMGAILFQFPWSFRWEDISRRHLMKLGSLFREYPVVAELRHGSWNCRESFSFLSDYGFTLCSVDQPLIGDSMPPLTIVTNPSLGYIRLHGRNRKNWFSRNAGRDQRYDYLYPAEEIAEWARRANEIISEVEKLFIITNNHFRGQALVNAFQLQSVLENREVDPPAGLRKNYPVLEKISVPSRGQQDLPGL